MKNRFSSLSTPVVWGISSFLVLLLSLAGVTFDFYTTWLAAVGIVVGLIGLAGTASLLLVQRKTPAPQASKTEIVKATRSEFSWFRGIALGFVAVGGLFADFPIVAVVAAVFTLVVVFAGLDLWWAWRHSEDS